MIVILINNNIIVIIIIIIIMVLKINKKIIMVLIKKQRTIRAIEYKIKRGTKNGDEGGRVLVAIIMIKQWLHGSENNT